MEMDLTNEKNDEIRVLSVTYTEWKMLLPANFCGVEKIRLGLVSEKTDLKGKHKIT